MDTPKAATSPAPKNTASTNDAGAEKNNKSNDHEIGSCATVGQSRPSTPPELNSTNGDNQHSMSDNKILVHAEVHAAESKVSGKSF